MSAKFPRGGGGAGPFLARSLLVLLNLHCMELQFYCNQMVKRDQNGCATYLFYILPRLSPRHRKLFLQVRCHGRINLNLMFMIFFKIFQYVSELLDFTLTHQGRAIFAST